MKKIFFVLASVLFSMGMQAQTVHVYNNDGTVDSYSNDEVDYVIFTAPVGKGTEDTSPVQLWEGGPLWARWNLGASKEEQVGGYFQWAAPNGFDENNWTNTTDGKNYWWKCHCMDSHGDTYCDVGGDYTWWDRAAWLASTPTEYVTDEQFLWRFINKYQIPDNEYENLRQVCNEKGDDFSAMTPPMWYDNTGKFTPAYVLVDDRDKGGSSKAFGLDGNYLTDGEYRVVPIAEAAGRYSRPARFLDPKDDAAFMLLNPTKKYEDKGTWRMPTHKELKRLFSLPYELVEKNGVPGIEFTGTTGKKLFLPAGGYRLNHDLLEKYTCGYYWSSDLSENGTCWGKYQGFSSEGIYENDLICPVNWRFLGYSIRPVKNNRKGKDLQLDGTYVIKNEVGIDRDHWQMYNVEDEWITTP